MPRAVVGRWRDATYSNRALVSALFHAAHVELSASLWPPPHEVTNAIVAAAPISWYNLRTFATIVRLARSDSDRRHRC
jgi:hypothetical protein